MAAFRTGTGFALACAPFVWVSAASCSGDSFSANESGGRGGSPTLGGSNAAGQSAGGVAGGRAGAGGTAGNDTGGTRDTGGAGGVAGGDGGVAGGDGGVAGGDGGAPPCGTDAPCAQHEYCGSDGSCRRCDDLTSLEDPGSAIFATPEPLSVLNAAAGDWYLRSPRPFGDGGALLYVRDFFGGEIWLTGDPLSNVGAPVPNPVSDPDFLEGAPLWFEPRENGALDAMNFVFNRMADTSSPHELYGARLDVNGTVSDIMRLPPPFNPVTPFSEASYAMAVSRDRAFWMVNRDLMFALQFLTAPLDASGPPSVVPLDYSDDCALTEFDVGAWVTPDGRLLFVSATERDASCAPLAGDTKDVVMFQLDESGQALGPAIAVNGINRAGESELDASLSADMCWLYFSRMDGDKLRLARARRER
jgi:hypothetical protein